jgi:hypothetical protein
VFRTYLLSAKLSNDKNSPINQLFTTTSNQKHQKINLLLHILSYQQLIRIENLVTNPNQVLLSLTPTSSPPGSDNCGGIGSDPSIQTDPTVPQKGALPTTRTRPNQPTKRHAFLRGCPRISIDALVNSVLGNYEPNEDRDPLIAARAVKKKSPVGTEGDI